MHVKLKTDATHGRCDYCLADLKNDTLGINSDKAKSNKRNHGDKF